MYKRSTQVGFPSVEAFSGSKENGGDEVLTDGLKNRVPQDTAMLQLKPSKVSIHLTTTTKPVQRQKPFITSL